MTHSYETPEQQGMFKTCPEPTPKEGALSKAAGPLTRGAYGSVANNVFEGNKGFYLRVPQTRIVNFTGVFQLGPT